MVPNVFPRVGIDPTETPRVSYTRTGRDKETVERCVLKLRLKNRVKLVTKTKKGEDDTSMRNLLEKGDWEKGMTRKMSRGEKRLLTGG